MILTCTAACCQVLQAIWETICMLHLGDHLYTWRQLECERNGALQAHDPRDRGNLVSIEHIVATALSPKPRKQNGANNARSLFCAWRAGAPSSERC